MKTERIIPYLLAAMLGFSGCAVLDHLDEISALGQYSREKDNQQRLVKSINDHYDALTKAIDQKTISDYKDETSFVNNFGDPILKKDLGDGAQRWLYRYAVYTYAKDKVYVYFDRNGKQVRWEKLSCPKFF